MSKTRKYSTTTEAEIRALVAQGLTNKEMAARLNVAEVSLANARSLLGIKSVAVKPRVAVGSWWVAALASGAPLEKIAIAEGKSYPTIWNALKTAGLPTSRKAAAEYVAGLNKPQPVSDAEPNRAESCPVVSLAVAA